MSSPLNEASRIACTVPVTVSRFCVVALTLPVIALHYSSYASSSAQTQFSWLFILTWPVFFPLSIVSHVGILYCLFPDGIELAHVAVFAWFLSLPLAVFRWLRRDAVQQQSVGHTA